MLRRQHTLEIGMYMKLERPILREHDMLWYAHMHRFLLFGDVTAMVSSHIVHLMLDTVPAAYFDVIEI